MRAKPAPTEFAIHELLSRRWSPRAFDPGKPLSLDEIATLIEAARWAPSCFNAQPWRYLVCDRNTHPESWERLHGCLAEKNRRWAQHAPLLLLCCGAEKFPHNGQPNRWHQYDSGAASLSLCLQATAMGLAAHQMGGFDQTKARAVFNIPAEYHPMAVIAVGHPGALEQLDADFHEAELGPRQRDERAAHFFLGEWPRP